MIYSLAEKVIYEHFSNAYGKEAYITRFSDTKDANRGRVGNWVALSKKPSDFMVTVRGNTFYAEVKSTEKYYIDSSLFKTQKNERLKIEKAGGTYIYFVYEVNSGKWYMLPGEMADRGRLEFKHLQEYVNSNIPSI